MSIASILVLVEGDESSSAVVRAAFELAQRHDAYLEVLHVRPDPRDAIPLMGDGMTGAMVTRVMTEIRERSETQAAEARRLFEEACQTADLPVRDADEQEPRRGRAAWRMVEGRPETALVDCGLLFDLLMIARPDPEKEGSAASGLETALFEIGGPVLVVPPDHTGRIGERAIVAWNGKRESARAMTAALPLLKRAKAVRVLSVAEGDSRANPRAAAQRLALHRIDAQAVEVPEGRPAGEALLQEISDQHADLLVMGAYGHSRLRQFVIGGVTRRLLAEAPVPVLMAH